MTPEDLRPELESLYNAAQSVAQKAREPKRSYVYRDLHMALVHIGSAAYAEERIHKSKP